MSSPPVNNIQRILLIDDDPEHLAHLQLFLEKSLEAVVDVVTTSAGAEEKVNERCYDLVISDVGLRGELGTRIVQRLLEHDPEQPVLLLSNYDRRESIMADARELTAPLFPKLHMSHPRFLTLLRSLLSRRPCVNQAARAVSMPGSSEGDSEPKAKSGSTTRINLTSPLVRAARASFGLIVPSA